MWTILALLAWAAGGSTGPIRTDPNNPHFFNYHGRPILLITSAEHYGGVINKAFDYKTNFDTLRSFGLNYTRFYPGAYLESYDARNPFNTLGPSDADLIVPWARSSTPGYFKGGNKFDLDAWDPAYFARMKDFIVKAAERDIVVEICLFNAQWPESWPNSPLKASNNIQGVGDVDGPRDFQTLKNAALVARQDAYVAKIVREVNRYDNVILEVCDEPIYTGTTAPDASAWVDHLLQVIVDTEKSLPKKHLISQEKQGDVDFTGDARVGIVCSQYPGGDGGQLSTVDALDIEYAHNKPAECNESLYYPHTYKGDAITASRVEAWEFMVGGGAAYNHLNARFTATDARGNTPDNLQILTGFRNLKEFLYGFEFVKMRKDTTLLKSGLGANAWWRASSEPGRQYALYLWHGTRVPNQLMTETGSYREDLVLVPAAGDYSAEWINPVDGKVIERFKLHHTGGERHFTTPSYTVDAALRLRALAAAPEKTGRAAAAGKK